MQESLEKGLLSKQYYEVSSANSYHRKTYSAKNAQSPDDLLSELCVTEEATKFLSGYITCAVEAKKFLLKNGISPEFLKCLPSYNVAHDKMNESLKNCSKKGLIQSNKTVSSNSVQNKREILNKIRTKIIERRRQKLAIGIWQKIWRPW